MELSLVDIISSEEETLEDKLTRKNRLYKWKNKLF
jgi:hypothetical protein